MMRFKARNVRGTMGRGAAAMLARLTCVTAVLALTAGGAGQVLLPLPAKAAEPCVGDCNGDGHVSIDELIVGVNIALALLPKSECPAFGQATISDLVTAVNNALFGCAPAGPTATPSVTLPPTPTDTPTMTPTPTTPTSGELGMRTFSIGTYSKAGQNTRSQFVSTAAKAFYNPPNLAAEFSAGPLKLHAGAVGPDGKAPLHLAEDAIFGYLVAIGGYVICFRAHAEASEGYLACQQGPRPDLVLEEAGGRGVPPAETRVVDGPPVTGGAVLRVTIESARLSPPETLASCETTTAWEPAKRFTFATGLATSTKGAQTISAEGESFSCDAWTTEDGPGMLVVPMVDYTTTPVEVGDTANVLRLADVSTPPPATPTRTPTLTRTPTRSR